MNSVDLKSNKVQGVINKYYLKLKNDYMLGYSIYKYYKATNDNDKKSILEEIKDYRVSIQVVENELMSNTFKIDTDKTHLVNLKQKATGVYDHDHENKSPLWNLMVNDFALFHEDRSNNR